MIISASRRTDIPAYYAEWFMNRVREGYCDVANPFNPRQVSRVSLRPDDVDAIVFWTRNAAPLLPHLEELDERGYRYYFQYTLVDYPPPFEPAAPPLAKRLATFVTLADRIGADRVVWRYDPIILSNHTHAAFHGAAFKTLSEALAGHTRRCVVSLLDVYAKVGRRLERLRSDGIELLPLSDTEAATLMSSISRMASEQTIEVFTCAETADFSASGIRAGRCIDDELIDRVFGVKVPAAKDSHQRKACRCVVSRDIGAYNTCPAGCLYCYANDDPNRAAAARRHHDDSAAAL